MSLYKCKICGKLFERVGNGVYCKGPHYRECVVCGNLFEYSRPSDPRKCCSRQCTNKLSELSKKSRLTRVCKECGKPFHPIQASQIYCPGPHVSTCKVCGNSFEYTVRPSEKPETCSSECRKQLQADTVFKRYGVDNVSKLQLIKDKISAANRSEEVKAKREYTSLQHWGVTNPAKSVEISKKLSEIMSSEEYLSKRRATCLKKYGVESPMQSAEVKAKLNTTNQLRYGVDWATQSEQWKQSKIATNIQKYGVPHYCMTEDCKNKQGHIISEHNKHISSLLDDHSILNELEFALCGKSYDIHLLNTNILIEVDPTYTHNSVGNHWGPGLDSHYHRDKSAVAHKQGYRCIHIFDWDDTIKILSMLSPSDKTIYARQCDIREVPKSECDTFLNLYHLQGTVSKQMYRYGLFYNDELVQVMTFGCPRYNKNYQWELLRLCTEVNVRVIGGASKLFKHFIQSLNPDSVISYCDLAKFDGHVYEMIGMTLDHISDPAIHWSRYTKQISDNLLRARGYDQLFSTNYGKGTSNEQLMLDNGWLPVYDCGQAVYIYMKPDQVN